MRFLACLTMAHSGSLLNLRIGTERCYWILMLAGFSLGQAPGQPVRRNSTFNDWLYSQGFAIGGITREPVSYDFIQAADYLMDVRQHFIQRWNEPERTLALGTSRGAFVVRMNLELYPDIYDGGFMNAGGGGGEIAVLNNKLNSLFVLKNLVNPDSPLALVNIDVQVENAALIELVDEANSTPQGRARLAFAASMQQFALWATPSKPKPAQDDFEEQTQSNCREYCLRNRCTRCEAE